MPAKIAIRADASHRIGSGHVMRMLTLAAELRRQSADVMFVSREHPGNAAAAIHAAGFPLAPLACDPLAADAWLGANLADEIAATRSVLASGVDILVVDHYKLDARWEDALRSHATRIVAVDDLADRPHVCDVLLDQTFAPAMDERYRDLVPPHAVQCLGPHYALLREEFVDVAAHPRTRTGAVERLFVFFGGADSDDYTGRALEAIRACGPEHFAVDVVIGAANPRVAQMRERLAAFPRGRLLCDAKTMAEMMNAADLALGATGMTSWERCAVGLPSIVGAIAENQIPIARNLAALGAVVDVGPMELASPDAFAKALRALCLDPPRVQAIGQAARALMGDDPAGGAARVAAVVLG
jgi:UDP-2,4-diacetamido-2,4,6-trideoxy-beta-L-altropyranose hydrolase